MAALTKLVMEPIESEAVALAVRLGRPRGTYDLPAARMRIAQSLPWSLPADLQLLQRLILEPTECTARLRAAFSSGPSLQVENPDPAEDSGMPQPSLSPRPPRPPPVTPSPLPDLASGSAIHVTPVAKATPTCSQRGVPAPITPAEHDAFKRFAEERFTDVQRVAGEWQKARAGAFGASFRYVGAGHSVSNI